MPAACAQICAKLKFVDMLKRFRDRADRVQYSSGGSMTASPSSSQVDEVFQEWIVSKEAARATEVDRIQKPRRETPYHNALQGGGC